jgi:hypothetical protein
VVSDIRVFLGLVCSLAGTACQKAEHQQLWFADLFF